MESDKAENNIYEVGKLYHPGKTSWSFGTDWNWRDNALELRLMFPFLTSADVQMVKHGRCSFAFTVQRGIIFFLFEFGRACPWSDNSYSIHLVPEEQRTLPPVLGKKEKALLHIYLISCESGILRAKRYIQLSHDFSEKLYEAIRKQAEQPFDREVHDQNIAKVYEEYPETSLLLVEAEAICVVSESNQLQ